MKKKFDIKGMTCASCQAHVFNAVSKLDGASNVNVNLLKNTLELDCDESKLNDNDIIKSVDNAGYKAIPSCRKDVKKEEKDLSIDDMLKLFVKDDDEKKPVKKGISFNIDTDNSKWHS